MSKINVSNTHHHYEFPVVLPQNVLPGDTLHVQAPNGQLHQITVPLGVLPGGRFMVRIASEEPSAPPPAFSINTPSVIVNPVSTVPTSTTNTFVPNVYIPSYPSAPPSSGIVPHVYVPR